MTKVRRFLTFLALLSPTLILSPPKVHGQDAVRPLRLGEAVAKAAEPFSSIGQVVELTDNRLVVSDDKEMRLVVIDPDGAAREIGRRGSGPGEFRVVGPLMRDANGGALLVDFALRRLLSIKPDGALGDAMLYPTGLMLRGTDGTGNVYSEAFVPRVQGGARSDSMFVVRWVPASGRVDTLMKVDAGVTKWSGPRDQPRRPFAEADSWVELSNGDLLIARGRDYRFSVMREGRETRAFKLPFARIPVTDAQKKRFLDEEAAKPVQQMGQSGATATPGPPPKYEFPASYPPFGGEGIGGSYMTEAPNGHVWIELLVPPGATERRYDVIDAARGERVGQVAMPAAHRVVGFGTSKVFVAEPDQDDVQFVRSYRYPSAR